jgi:hypothetical protein
MRQIIPKCPVELAEAINCYQGFLNYLYPSSLRGRLPCRLVEGRLKPYFLVGCLLPHKEHVINQRIDCDKGILHVFYPEVAME